MIEPSFISPKKVRKLVSCLVILCSLLIIDFSMATNINHHKESKQQNTDKLNDVQKAIAKQESTIFKTNKNRTALEKQLKSDDLAIAKIAKSISDTNQKLTAVNQKIAAFTKEKQQLAAKKIRQENLLAQQLRSAYTTGQHDYLKLLLNQDESDKIQRTISYYQYLNKARMVQIDKFQSTITQLMQVTTQHQVETKKLQALKINQQKQRANLRQKKNKRSQTIASLNKKLLSSKQQLTKLKAEEANLTAALQKLTALIRAEIDLMGLSKLKRKLSWPVKGRLLHRFGSRKQGYLKWKGVLFRAPIGKQVQTIHSGTILFSDWLKGYGLLTVIDHGKGYMSLYAHNQTLLKSVGDRVETGEPIALVGQSGGQNQPGLYFEIRHQGKAVNPKLWCR